MFFLNKQSRKQASDKELLKAYAQKSNLNDLAELFNRYLQLTYGVCLKYLKNKDDAQDAAMQIFEKLIHDANRFEINNFKSWLYVYTKNFCLMKIRTDKAGLSVKQIADLQLDMEKSMAMHHTFEDNDKVSLENNLNQLEKCIETLVNEQQQCVRLFFLKELSYKNIAQKTGFELNKVKSYIQNGKRNLKICMENEL